MKKSFVYWIRGLLLALLAWMTLATPAFSAPGLDFSSTTEPTVWTTAGSAQSFMNTSWDMNVNLISSVPSSSSTPPKPDVRQVVQFKTWNDGTNLRFKFQIPDYSMRVASYTLTTGDTLVIQINGNNSGETAIQADDYRFELTLKDKLIFSQKLKHGNGAVSPNWNLGSAKSYASTPVVNGANYLLDITIPFADVGVTSGSSFGLSIGWVNDFGYTYMESTPTGTVTKSYLSGAAFPADMLLTDASQPGLSGEAANGHWKDPTKWGQGYFIQPAQAANVAFSHSPAFYFSDSIRLGLCSAMGFDDIGAADPSTFMSQNTIKNWYLYNSGGPCKMGIWVRANASGAAGKARFLVMWADGGLGQGAAAWRTVALTPEVILTPGQVTFTEFWGNVPANGSSSPNPNNHPCLKIYALPPDSSSLYTGTWSTTNLANNAQADVGAFEQHFGLQDPNIDFKSAQMNFNNLTTGTCQQQICALAPMRERVHVAFLGDASGLGSVLAQNDSLRSGTDSRAVIDQPTGNVKGDPKQGEVRIWVTGFGVSTEPSSLPYKFVEEVGGLGWSIPSALIDSGVVSNLGFTVGNPAVLYRDFSKTPVVEMKSPPRRLVLSTVIQTAPGVSKPYILKGAWDDAGKVLQAGESTPVTMTLAGEKCNCGCNDVACRLKNCTKLAENDSGAISGTLTLVGTLGVGGFAFLRRRRNQKSSGLVERTED